MSGRNSASWRLRLAAATALVLGLSVVAAAPAFAIPPEGASPNTPGTWSEVSPGTVAPGGVINFTLGGFPAGQDVNIKINDGALCDNTSHGACVYAQQRVPSSGVVSGSIQLPSNLADGTYWLRFLASAPAPGGQPGTTIGFTNASPDFTVRAGAAGGSGGGGASNGGSSSGGQSSGGSGGTASGGGSVQTTEQGGVVDVTQAEAVEPTVIPAIPDSAALAGVAKLGSEVLDGRIVLTLGEAFAGEWAFLADVEAESGLGWQRVAADGTVSAPIALLEPGERTVAVIDVDGATVGWAELDVPEPSSDAVATPISAPLDGETSDATGFPVTGVVGLVAVVLVLGAAIAIIVTRRRAQSKAAPKEEETASP